MRRVILLAFLIALFGTAAKAQTVFTLNCVGIPATDTSLLNTQITNAGTTPRTIALPAVPQCSFNTFTTPTNVTIDATNAQSAICNIGQTCTVNGSYIIAPGRALLTGGGTIVITGASLIDGIKTGNGAKVPTSTGTLTAGHCIQMDASGNMIDAGAPCGTGGGGGGGLGDPGVNGVIVRTALNTTTARSIAGTSNQISISNADGTTGNPTISIPNFAQISVSALTNLTTNGFVKTTGGNGGLLVDTTTYVPTTRQIIAGPGLVGGGDLSTDRTLSLNTPGNLSVTSTNVATGSHTHAIITSSNPGATASILASQATSPQLTLNDALLINNVFLRDNATGFTSPGSTVVSPINNNAIRSNSYTSGLVGWNINGQGDAQFNNVDVRGAIRTSVFLYNELLATAGTLGVFRSACKLKSDATVPSSPTYGTTAISIDCVDQDGVSHAASHLFANNDILRMKDGLAGDTWFKVASASDQTFFWRYSATIMAGSNNVTYRAGAGVADYGISGNGFILQSADQTNAPWLQMATHAATFSSQDVSGSLLFTPQLRLGNLNGSYGYNVDTYGFATGTYAVNNTPSITVEPTNGIRILGGTGGTTVIGQWDTSGNIIIGGAAASNTRILPGDVQLRYGSTVWTDVSSAGIQLGQTGAGVGNTFISPTGVSVRVNTTPVLQAINSGLYIGANLNSTSTFFVPTTSFTYNSESVSAGDVIIGDTSISNAGNVKISATGSVSIRRGLTDYITLNATDAQFKNVLKITGSGVISIQGSGTLAGFVLSASNGEVITNGNSTSTDGAVFQASDLGTGGFPSARERYQTLYDDGVGHLSYSNFALEGQSDSSGGYFTISGAGGSSPGAFTKIMTLTLNGGMRVGANPTGGDKGAGTINISGDIYKQGASYTNPDFVVEKWATGDITKFADKPGANVYSGLMPLTDLRQYMKDNLHLPRFGQNANLGLFSGGDALLATIEELHLYLFQLEDRIKVLEDQLAKKNR